MTRFEENILEILKRQYVSTVGNRTFRGTEKTEPFYLKELNDNLYSPMSVGARASYMQGNGNELDQTKAKMNALRSSSAMTYNLFWDSIAELVHASDERLGIGVYQVELEKRYHTLKTSVSPFSANLDAFLYCKWTKEAIACEMKLAEWLLDSPRKLKATYLNPPNYIDPEAGRVFTAVAQSLVNPSKFNNPDPKDYQCRLSHYDAFQMFKHAVACYTACMKEEAREIKKLTLVNCVWTLPNADMLERKNQKKYVSYAQLEQAEFEDFKTAMRPVIQLFKDQGVDFDISFYTFSDFLRLFRKTSEELEYLRRYTF